MSLPSALMSLLGSVVLLAVSCTPPAATEDALTRSDVVLAYVDDGLDAETADCLVGLASREFDLDAILPGSAEDFDALLIDEMLISCQDALTSLNEEELDGRQSFDVGPFNLGDDQYLDELWFGCEQGDGADCDQLWAEAPVGSVYESFGVTCGNRPAVLDCTLEMNGPDRTPQGAS